MKSEFTTEVVKAIPPLAVVAASVTNAVDWQQISYMLASLWIVVQLTWWAGVRIYRWRNKQALDTITGDE